MIVGELRGTGEHNKKQLKKKKLNVDNIELKESGTSQQRKHSSDLKALLFM